MIILIFGARGSGKTVLAATIADRMGGILVSEEDLRLDLCQDLENAEDLHAELARRANAVARLIDLRGFHCILDVSCQTPAARKAMSAPMVKVWVDRLKESSDLYWSEPRSEEYDLKINNGLSVKQESDFIFAKMLERH